MKTPDTLTLAEVAAYLGWTPRFVERLAVGGKLPGEEIDGQWRFRREVLIDWLEQKLQTFDAVRVAEFEHRLESELEADGLFPKSSSTPLAARLNTAAIRLDLPAGGKAQVVQALADLAAGTGRVLAPARFHASLVEREALCSTALPGGVALVHPRRPQPGVLSGSVLAFGRTLEPVDFGAADGERTQLFFVVGSLDEREHLHALARLARLIRGGTVPALRSASNTHEVLALIRRFEGELDASGTR